MSNSEVNERVIKFLSDPETYGVKRPVKVIQTHASYVFISGGFVYKLKKPVNFGFLDYSTLEKRKYFCAKEVGLNSRFSTAYIGVMAISELNGDISFGKQGRILEYVVKMKRIPDRYFMKNMLRRGLITKRDINRVADRLYSFYSFQPAGDMSRKHIKFDIAGILKQNRDLATKFCGSTVSEIAFDTINFYNTRFLKINRKLLRQRIKDGYVRDCHGDLHLEHVIIRNGKIELFDCIEFNENFRIIDYVCDIAFLSMDLDYHGYYELSSYFTSLIIKKMGDQDGLRLVDFYKSYRAYVRGKVESLRSVDKHIADEYKRESDERARKYFRLSLCYCLFASDPVIIVVFGMIGAGKTTFAHRLSNELGGRVISSDVVRKKLAGIKPSEKGSAEIYSKKMTEKTYGEMLKIAEQSLKENNIVILDASYSNKKYRELVMRRTRKWKARNYFVEVSARERDIKERLRAREHATSISDARLDLLDRFKASYQQPYEIPGDKLFKTSPTKNIEENVRSLFRELIRLN